ncbi:hypothetical protein PC119_g28611 [Phytophthora cactorum]|nr:hypothetical protein PC119_g28611 [Phytophthora cactorum]
MYSVEGVRVDDIAADLAIETDDLVARSDGSRKWLGVWEVDGVEKLVADAVSVREM